jgi:hypothetical protein
MEQRLNLLSMLIDAAPVTPNLAGVSIVFVSRTKESASTVVQALEIVVKIKLLSHKALLSLIQIVNQQPPF